MNDVINRNYSGQSASRLTPDAPQQPQAAALTSGIMERLGRLDELAGRLEALADRVVGAEPTKAQAGDAGPARVMPNHVTARMDAVVEVTEFLNGRIAYALQRLERFA